MTMHTVSRKAQGRILKRQSRCSTFWAVFALLAFLSLVVPTSARAKTNGEAPQKQQATIQLLQQAPVLKEDGVFYVDLSVFLPVGVKPAFEVAGTLYQRTKSRQEFALTNLGTSLGSVLGVTSTIELGTNLGGDLSKEREIPLRIQLTTGPVLLTCPSCIALRTDGVYPLLIELRSTASESVVDRLTTYVTRATQPQADPLQVALIVPLKTSSARNANGEEQIPATRNIIGIIEALVARKSTPVTIAPTPETLDTLARLAEQNSASNPLVNQIRDAALGREVLLSPYVALHSGLTNNPQLDRLIEGNQLFGLSTINRLLGGSNATGIGIYNDRLVGSRALEQLRQQRLVVQESALEQPDAQAQNLPTLIDVAAIDKSDGVAVPAVVLDQDLEGHFVHKVSQRTAGADDVLRAQHLLADLAVLQGSPHAGPHGVAVMVPESTSQATLAEVMAGLENNDLVRPITLSKLFSLPFASSGKGALVRTPIIKSVSLPIPQVTQVNQILDRLDGYRSAFHGPALDADDLEKRLLVALASLNDSDVSAPKAGFFATISRIADEANARIGTIHLSPTDRVTLTAREQDVPIPIINESGQPTTVVLEVSSDNVSIEGSIADPSRPRQLFVRRTIVIDTRVHQEQVLITTRGPGSFSLVVRLTTPTGLPLSSVRYTLRSTAVAGLGKVLTIGALLVLAGWWIRSTLSTRRRNSVRHHPSRSPLNETPK